MRRLTCVAVLQSGSRGCEQDDGQGSQPFATSCETESLTRRCLDAQAAHCAGEVGRKVRAHRLRVRRYLRLFADDGHVRIAESEAGVAHQLGAVAQEVAAVRTAPAFIGRRKMSADVAERECTENRVAQRVDHDIAVGMRDDAAAVGDAHTTEYDVIAVTESVDVVTLTDSQTVRLARMNSANARSSGVVTLILLSLPSTSKGR